MLKQVEQGSIGVRLDVFVQEMGDITRSAAQRLIESGNVAVNDKVKKANYRLSLGDDVAIYMPEPISLEIMPENIPLDVVYEDAELVVVNKPKGMVVHPAAGHAQGTLVNALMFHCGDSLSGINGVMRPGIVHRIDKDTSGLLVVAKTDVAHTCLAAQFADHSITREYAAIVHGRPNPANGTVDAPLARHRLDRKKMAIDPAGRHAVTHYQTLEELGIYTLISARLETGRTHQIRVHMAHIGNPVLADPVYCRSKPGTVPKVGGRSPIGQLLHARKLGFVHPSGEYMEFEADPPECFAGILQKLRG